VRLFVFLFVAPSLKFGLSRIVSHF
jgi:hypothetical protein